MEELRRSTTNAVIGGVSAGLARYFHTNPILFRLLFILTAFWSGTGLLIYIVLWIGLPNDQAPEIAKAEPDTQENNNQQFGGTSSSTMATGILLIVLGILFLLEKFIPAFYFEKFWPLLLIMLGVILLYNSGPDEEIDQDTNSSNEKPSTNQTSHSDPTA